MGINQIDKLTEELLSWEAIADDAKKEADAIKKQLKEEMLERDVEELSTGKYILKFQTVVRNIFATAEFKKLHMDLYKAFTKPSESKRFEVIQ